MTFMDTGDTSQFNRYMYANNDPINMWDPNGEDGVALTVDVDAYFIIGVGGTFGGYVEFEWRAPSVDSVIDGVMDNPLNPLGVVLDAVTDTTEIGLTGSINQGGGYDVSAAIAPTYFQGDAQEDFSGGSLNVQGGVEGVGVEVSSYVDGGLPDAISLEIGPSTPVSATISEESTWTKPLIQKERTDFD